MTLIGTFQRLYDVGSKGKGVLFRLTLAPDSSGYIIFAKEQVFPKGIIADYTKMIAHCSL